MSLDTYVPMSSRNDIIFEHDDKYKDNRCCVDTELSKLNFSNVSDKKICALI